MTFDVESLRRHFPSLVSGIAHFDGPGGTQTPTIVATAIAETLTGPLSNRGTVALSERNAEAAIGGFRTAMSDLLAADPQGIVYGRSATQLTYDFSRTLALTRGWGPGDEIVVSQLDHDCNVRPWVQIAQATGAGIRWIPLDPDTGELDLTNIEEIVNERTQLVAVTAASNLLGTMPPVRQIADRAHSVGALVYVDGVHYAAHAAVDVTALGADFFVCSPYKFFGPHCAALAAHPDVLHSLTPNKLLPSTNDVPERFELGTLPYELMAGVTAAVDFIASIGTATDTPSRNSTDSSHDSESTLESRRTRLINAHAQMALHENRLLHRMEEGLTELAGSITVHSRAAERTSTVFMTFDGRDAHEAYTYLAALDVLAPAGNFYAHEPFQALRLQQGSGLRVGLAPYSTDSEIDRLLDGLRRFVSAPIVR